MEEQATGFFREIVQQTPAFYLLLTLLQYIPHRRGE
jgi:hypothetical protein